MFHLNRIGPPATKSGVVNVMDFDKVTSLIGRNKGQVDFVLDSSNHIASQYISRLHARVVRQENNSYRLFDDSLNGIFINNTKIMGSVVLHEGDIVTFGHPYGVRLKPGVWARQPDSEYQFIFERCNCEKPTPLKSTVLEDRVNTHPSVFKKPQQITTKALSSHHSDVKAKLSSTFGDDQSSKACVSPLPTTLSSKDDSSVNCSHGSSSKIESSSSTSSHEFLCPKEDSQQVRISSATLIDQENHNLMSSIGLNENVALAEASSIINKCMTTIAGMTKALISGSNDSLLSDSIPKQDVSSTSGRPMKENEERTESPENDSSELNVSSLDETKVLDNSTDTPLALSCDKGCDLYSNTEIGKSDKDMLPIFSESPKTSVSQTEPTVSVTKSKEDSCPVTTVSSTFLSISSHGLNMPLPSTGSSSSSSPSLPVSSSSLSTMACSTDTSFSTSSIVSFSTIPICSVTSASASSTEPFTSALPLFSSTCPKLSIALSSPVKAEISSVQSTPTSQNSSLIVSSSHRPDDVASNDASQNTISKDVKESKISSNDADGRVGSDESDKTLVTVTCEVGKEEKQIKHFSPHPEETSGSGNQGSKDKPSTSLSRKDYSNKNEKSSSAAKAVDRSKIISKSQKVTNCEKHIENIPCTSSTYVGRVTRGQKRKQKQICQCCAGDSQPKGKKSSIDSTSSPDSNLKSKKRQRGAGNNKQDSEDGTRGNNLDSDVVYLLSESNGVIFISDDEDDDDVSKSKKTNYGNDDSLGLVISNEVCITIDEEIAFKNDLSVNSGGRNSKEIDKSGGKKDESSSVINNDDMTTIIDTSELRENNSLVVNNEVSSSAVTHSDINVSLIQDIQSDEVTNAIASEQFGRAKEEVIQCEMSSGLNIERSGSETTDITGKEETINGPSNSSETTFNLIHQEQGINTSDPQDNDTAKDNENIDIMKEEIIPRDNSEMLFLNEEARYKTEFGEEPVTEGHKSIGDRFPEHCELSPSDFKPQFKGEVSCQDDVKSEEEICLDKQEIDNNVESRDIDREEDETLNDSASLFNITDHIKTQTRAPSEIIQQTHVSASSQIKEDNVEARIENDVIPKTEDGDTTPQIDGGSSSSIKDENVKIPEKDKNNSTEMKDDDIKSEIENSDAIPHGGVIPQREDVRPQVENDSVTSQMQEDSAKSRLDDDSHVFSPFLKGEELEPQSEDVLTPQIEDIVQPQIESINGVEMDSVTVQIEDHNVALQMDDICTTLKIKEDNATSQNQSVNPNAVSHMGQNGVSEQIQEDDIIPHSEDVTLQLGDDENTSDTSKDDVTQDIHGDGANDIENDNVIAAIGKDDVPQQIQGDDVSSQMEDGSVTPQIENVNTTRDAGEDDAVTLRLNDIRNSPKDGVSLRTGDVTTHREDDDVTTQKEDDVPMEANTQFEYDVTTREDDDDVTTQTEDNYVRSPREDDGVTVQREDDDITVQREYDFTAESEDLTSQVEDGVTAQIEDDVETKREDDAITQIEDVITQRHDNTISQMEHRDVTTQREEDDITMQRNNDVTTQRKGDDVPLEEDVIEKKEDGDGTTRIECDVTPQDDDVTSQIEHTDVTEQREEDDVTMQRKEDDITIQRGEGDVKTQRQDDNITSQIQHSDVTTQKEEDNFTTQGFEDEVATQRNGDYVPMKEDGDVTIQTEENDYVRSQREDDNVTVQTEDDVTTQIEDDATVQTEDDVTTQRQDNNITSQIEHADGIPLRDDDVTAQRKEDDITIQRDDDDVTIQRDGDNGDVTAPRKDDDNDVTTEIDNDDVMASHINDFPKDSAITQKEKNDVTSQNNEDDLTVDIQDDEITQKIEHGDVTQCIEHSIIIQQIESGDITQEMKQDDIAQQIESGDITQEMKQDYIVQQMECGDITQEMKQGNLSQQMNDSNVEQQIENVDITLEISCDNMQQSQNGVIKQQIKDDMLEIDGDQMQQTEDVNQGDITRSTKITDNEECDTNFAGANFITSTPADDIIAGGHVMLNEQISPVTKQSVVTQDSSVVKEQNVDILSRPTCVLDEHDLREANISDHNEDEISCADKQNFTKENNFTVQDVEFKMEKTGDFTESCKEEMDKENDASRMSGSLGFGEDGEEMYPATETGTIVQDKGFLDDDKDKIGNLDSEVTAPTMSNSVISKHQKSGEELSESANDLGESEEEDYDSNGDTESEKRKFFEEACDFGESEEEDYDSNGETESEKRKYYEEAMKLAEEEYERMTREESDDSEVGNDGDGLLFSESQEFEVFYSKVDQENVSKPCQDRESEAIQRERTALEFSAKKEKNKFSDEESESSESEEFGLGKEDGVLGTSVSENGKEEEVNELMYSESQEFGLEIENDNIERTQDLESEEEADIERVVSEACCGETYEIAMDSLVSNGSELFQAKDFEEGNRSGHEASKNASESKKENESENPNLHCMPSMKQDNEATLQHESTTTQDTSFSEIQVADCTGDDNVVLDVYDLDASEIVSNAKANKIGKLSEVQFDTDGKCENSLESNSLPSDKFESISAVEPACPVIETVFNTIADSDVYQAGSSKLDDGLQTESENTSFKEFSNHSADETNSPLQNSCNQGDSEASMIPAQVTFVSNSSPEKPETVESVFKLPISVSPISTDQQQNASKFSQISEECSIHSEELESCCSGSSCSDNDTQPKSQVSDFKEEDDFHLCWSQSETGSSCHASVECLEEENTHASVKDDSSTSTQNDESEKENSQVDNDLDHCSSDTSVKHVHYKAVSEDNKIKESVVLMSTISSENSRGTAAEFEDIDAETLGQGMLACELNPAGLDNEININEKDHSGDIPSGDLNIKPNTETYNCVERLDEKFTDLLGADGVEGSDECKDEKQENDGDEHRMKDDVDRERDVQCIVERISGESNDRECEQGASSVEKDALCCLNDLAKTDRDIDSVSSIDTRKEVSYKEDVGFERGAEVDESKKESDNCDWSGEKKGMGDGKNNGHEDESGKNMRKEEHVCESRKSVDESCDGNEQTVCANYIDEDHNSNNGGRPTEASATGCSLNDIEGAPFTSNIYYQRELSNDEGEPDKIRTDNENSIEGSATTVVKRRQGENDSVENEFISMKKIKLCNDLDLEYVADSPILPLVTSVTEEQEEDSDFEIELFPLLKSYQPINQSRKRKTSHSPIVEDNAYVEHSHEAKRNKMCAKDINNSNSDSLSVNLMWTPIEPQSEFELVSSLQTSTQRPQPPAHQRDLANRSQDEISTSEKLMGHCVDPILNDKKCSESDSYSGFVSSTTVEKPHSKNDADATSGNEEGLKLCASTKTVTEYLNNSMETASPDIKFSKSINYAVCSDLDETMSPIIENQDICLLVCPASSSEIESESDSKGRDSVDKNPPDLDEKVSGQSSLNLTAQDMKYSEEGGSIGALAEIKTNCVKNLFVRSSPSICTSPPPSPSMTISSKFEEEEEENDSLVVSTPPAQRRAKRESLYTAVVQELQRMNKDIRMFLSRDNPNVDQAMEVLEDLQDTPINSTALAKFPSILETLNKCRRYKQSDDVRQLSQRIYDRFKALL